MKTHRWKSTDENCEFIPIRDTRRSVCVGAWIGDEWDLNWWLANDLYVVLIKCESRDQASYTRCSIVSSYLDINTRISLKNWLISLKFLISLDCLRSSLVLICYRSLHSLSDVQIDLININHRLQCWWKFCLDHEVRRIVDLVNSNHLSDFLTFVELTKNHDIDHQTFFDNDL